MTTTVSRFLTSSTRMVRTGWSNNLDLLFDGRCAGRGNNHHTGGFTRSCGGTNCGSHAAAKNSGDHNIEGLELGRVAPPGDVGIQRDKGLDSLLQVENHVEDILRTTRQQDNLVLRGPVALEYVRGQDEAWQRNETRNAQ